MAVVDFFGSVFPWIYAFLGEDGHADDADVSGTLTTEVAVGAVHAGELEGGDGILAFSKAFDCESLSGLDDVAALAGGGGLTV